LSELQRILFASQNRLEMQPGRSKLRAYLCRGSLGIRVGMTPELRFGEALDDILF
jgi:hypothetical protein